MQSEANLSRGKKVGREWRKKILPDNNDDNDARSDSERRIIEGADEKTLGEDFAQE